MKLRQVWVVVVAAAMLAACNSRRESPTAASYGMDMLSGQVAVSGLPNGNPAGVEVSVRGTGMKTTLTDDGQFLFAGVPEGAQLDFYRAADGIQASMKVDAATGFLSIELTKTTANATKRSSRHRGSSPTREVVYEFEGTVVSSAADSLVIYTSMKEEETFALSADTIIRKGQTTYAAADLLEGWRVHVKAKKNADDTYSATVVIVQNTGGGDDDGAPPAVKEYEGTVVSSSATQLVVFTSHGEEKTFTVNGDTEIRKGNTPIAPEDILKGWRVHVKATEATDSTTSTTTSTATQVIVQNNPPEEVELEGSVVSVGSSSFVMTTDDGDVTVEVSPSTQIRKSNKKISLGDVHAGDAVAVEGTRVDATTVTAKKVTVG